MDMSSEFPSLVAAESPLAWAEENMDRVGAGETATVYAHPSSPDLVLRVSDYPDGWFAFAGMVSGLSDEGGALGDAARLHGPRALGMAYVEAPEPVYVAVCERLDPIPDEDAETHRIVAAAARLARTPYPPCLDPDDADALEEHLSGYLAAAVGAGACSREEVGLIRSRQPALPLLLASLGAHHTDLRPENWMMRGPHLVLNDAQRGMTFAEDDRFRAERSLVPGGIPSP